MKKGEHLKPQLCWRCNFDKPINIKKGDKIDMEEMIDFKTCKGIAKVRKNKNKWKCFDIEVLK